MLWKEHLEECMFGSIFHCAFVAKMMSFPYKNIHICTLKNMERECSSA